MRIPEVWWHKNKIRVTCVGPYCDAPAPARRSHTESTKHSSFYQHCTGTIFVPKALLCGWWESQTLYWYNLRPRNSVHYCWLYHNITRKTCKSARFSNAQKNNFEEKSGLSSFFLKMKVQWCSVALLSFPGWRPWQMPCVPTSLLPRYCWTLDNIFLGIFIFHKISYYIQSCPYYWGISQYFPYKIASRGNITNHK